MGQEVLIPIILGNTRSKNESGYRESYPERGLYKWILAKEKHCRRAI